MMGLYPYQKAGVAYLTSHRRAYLADVMGLGKTVQAAAAAALVKPASTLVVAPASTLPNWRREWEKWAGGVPVTVMSYDQARIRQPKDPFELVILDEAHYVKTISAKRTKVALSLAQAADWAWLLSGTPMPNHVLELWAPVRYLWLDEAREHGIHNSTEWANAFAITRDTIWGPKPVALKNPAALRMLLSKFMLRRTLEAASVDLPPLRVEVSAVDWDGDLEQELIAAGLTEEDVKLLERDELEQGKMSTVRRILGDLKVAPACAAIAEDLSSGALAKIVVLAHHRSVMDRAEKELKKFGLVRIDGSTPPASRDNVVQQFMYDQETKVFLGQQTASGTGLNLQAASEVVLLEPSWSPAENAQAIARVHRLGQSATSCRARIFVLPGTLDDVVMSVLANKTKMQTLAGLEVR